MKAHALSLGLLGVSGLIGLSVSPELKSTGPAAESLEAHEANGASTLVGQFRTSASAWLWLRTDLYLHGGVEMRALTEHERKAGHKAESASGEDGYREDENIVTVVPKKERDYRGIFGDIERHTSAFKPMDQHTHNDPESAIPLFRLMTWIDPEFLRGWTVGASLQARSDVRKAIAYLEEGKRANPNSIALSADIGRMMTGRLKQYKEALPNLQTAIALGERRYHGAVVDAETDEGEGFLNAFRYAALCHLKLEEPQLTRAVAASGLRFFPDDPVLLRLAAGQTPDVRIEGEEESGHVHGPDCDHDH